MGKKKLDKQVDNPFDDCSWSKPLTSKEVFNNVDRKPTKAKTGRKTGTRIQTKKKDEIIELFNKGLKQRDIAEQVGVDKSYVSKVVKEFT